MSNHFLTAQETAKNFFNGKVSTASIYRLAAAGEIPNIKIGKRILINIKRLKAKYT
ncbi:MAG: DNA-binding protein [Erysipelotrichia bacterium]|nr:DNA-binding protein [Erysipelotrichia bacterium]